MLELDQVRQLDDELREMWLNLLADDIGPPTHSRLPPEWVQDGLGVVHTPLKDSNLESVGIVAGRPFLIRDQWCVWLNETTEIKYPTRFEVRSS